MAHSTDCINNFDPNCEECIAWKKYRKDLNERRNFLKSYWAHLEKPKENLVPCQHKIKDNSFQDLPTADSNCSSCGKSFKTKKTLKAHIKHVHERKNFYSCGECGETFSRSDYLDAHMRSHRAEKPFSCNQCEKAFTHKQTLNKHVKICKEIR